MLSGFQLLFIIGGLAVSLSYGLNINQADLPDKEKPLDKKPPCIHDEIVDTDPHIVDLSSQDEGVNKRQTSSSYSNIRIHPMFTNVATSAMPFVQGENSLLTRGIRTLASILMVHPVDGNLRIPPMCSEYTFGVNRGKCISPLPSQSGYDCGEFGIIPLSYIGVREVCTSSSLSSSCTLQGPNGTGLPNADYLLFVSASSTSICSGGTLAYASHCMLDMSDNYRPVAGFINICPSALTSLASNENVVLGLLMHEIIHAIGFSSSLFSRFVNDSGVPYNPRRTISSPYGSTSAFTGPKTLALARSYYSCDSIEGVYLENQGGSGTASSHWEKRTLHHELMNGFISIDYLVLSEFTIALFEDSGWYKANYTALREVNQHPLQWGKGLGCSFLNQRCDNQSVYPYLCDTSTSQLTCTYDHLTKGTCSTRWGGFDNCPVAVADEIEDHCRTSLSVSGIQEVENYGNSSICISGVRLSSSHSCGTYINGPILPLCVAHETYTVNGNNKSIIYLDNTPYGCQDEHALLTNDSWAVLCPPAEEVVLRSPAISENLPSLSDATRIAVDELDVFGNLITSNDEGLEAFGLSSFASSVFIQLNVNVRNITTAPLCHLFGCSSCTSPVFVSNLRTSTLTASILYLGAGGLFTASIVSRDFRTQSTDYSLSLMLDPFANHSFVYYAASVDFVGDHLQVLHSNDDSVFRVVALANNTEVRIAPSRDVNINGMIVRFGEEYVMVLEMGGSVMVTSSEDLTGSRVTANKAVSFYSGHYCATGSTDNCSVLIEQIPPFNSWGNSFILHTNVSGLIGNMFKLISSDIGAGVSINCTSDGINYESNNYHLGFRQHLALTIVHDYCRVDSDENILIIQFRDSNFGSIDTFMTVVPSLDHFDDFYVFNAYNNFTNYVALTVTATDPNINSFLLNNFPAVVSWRLITLNDQSLYYGVLTVSSGRHTLTISGGGVKFGAVLYGSGGSDTYALPAGMSLDVATDLPSQAPSPVQDAVLTLVDGMINVTWTPPVVPNGIIVQRVNSSGKFYHYVPANQHSISLPHINDALVFVAAVNLYGQSVFERANSQIPCLPSPCINNGTCIVRNGTSTCTCTATFLGENCEMTQKLYPFGTAQSDARLPPLDDGSSSAITLIRSFRFYGPASSTAYVNSNGVVSLDRSFTSFSPRSLPLNGTDKIIAPYWDDVDTRGIGNIYYRQTTDPSLLARATSEIRVASPMSEPLSNLFIATWDAVGSFPRGTNMTNTFQCILAYSAVESFVIFLYDDGGIEWGRGLAGINAGNRVSSVTIPGSRTVNILNIDQTTNIGIPGVWVFQVDRAPSSSIVPIPSSSFVPIPSSSFVPIPSSSFVPIQSSSFVPIQSSSFVPIQSSSFVPIQSSSFVLMPSSFVPIPSSLPGTGSGCQTNTDPYLIFVTTNDIRRINIDGTGSQTLVTGLSNGVGIDFHYNKDRMYWTDVSLNHIRTAPISTGYPITTLVSGLSVPDGLAVDWINDNLYWTDTGTNTLEQSDLDGNFRRILVSNADEPRGIALNPMDNTLYMTDWGSNPRIERMRLDGSGRQTIITQNLVWPNAVTIDFTEPALYWADAFTDIIAKGDLDGNNIVILLSGSFHPFSITVFGDYLYWTDWSHNSIERISKRTPNSQRVTISSGLQRPTGIHIVHCSRQDIGGAVGPIISFNPSGFLQNTKGQRQDVICSVTVPSEVDPDTVELEWLNADNITTDDGRITIISADNSTGLNSSTLSTTLRFDPLFEDDQDNYTCYSVVNDTMMFQTVELTNFRLPNPVVLVTTLDDQVLGDPFMLDCTVITVIGISSAVDIIWSVDGRTVRIVNDTLATISNNSAIYTDSLALPELTALDNGRIYQCTVLINKNPPVSFSGSMMLNFFAPVCFNTTICDGGSIINNDSVSFNDSAASFNDSISFRQCCFELSGISYASNGQCLLCPKTDCSIEVVKDIVFLIDTTRSIGSFRFQHIREFVANVTTDLKLISPDSRVGVILFDWFTRLQFNLQRHTSLSTLLPAINPGLPYINSYFSTNTGNALEFLLSSAQNGVLGIRNETSNIAIVITDGLSDNQFLTQSAAAALHAANIFDIYAIGFGSAGINELHTIASDPRFVYFTNFYSEFALQELKMNITDQLCSVPSPGISLQPSGFFSGTIGQMQDLICSVTITSAIDPDSVQLIWLDSENIITSDNRVTVTPTNITSNAFSFTYTTVLQFAYLMEGDEGNYTCNLVADDMLESQTVRLQNFRIPLPVVEVTTLNTPTLGLSTTLQCSAISVRGISSRVDIIWTTGNTTERRVDGIVPDITNNSAIYNDLLVTQPLLIPDDGRVYQCTVIFNTSPRIVRSRFIILDFPVPSCYITSGCSGDPLNQTITFSDCCTRFSGVSYDLDSRCQPCPISPNCTFVAVKDVVFVIDTTSSIGFSRFQLVRELTENITATLIANSPESLVGVILFDDFARLQFNISRHTSLSTLLPAINPGLPYYRGFRTDTARALDFLRTSAQFGSLQLRNETSNVAIFITDGLSRSSFSTQSAAFRLHATNIFDVYAVGIGGNSLSELRTIASDPSLVFSTSFFDSFSAQRILEEVTEQLCFTPTPRTFLDPDVPRGIIGEAIDIVCTVTITSTVDSNLVNLNWVGITSSNRITVVPTVLTTDDSIGNIYTTIIQFDYLMEGDEGNYICNLMIEDSANSTIRLDLISIDSSTFVEITATNIPTINQPLALQCSAVTLIAITSRVDIIWRTGNTQVRRQNNILARNNGNHSVYDGSLVITSSLSIDDIGSTYECEVVIHSFPPTTATTHFTVPIPPASECRCSSNAPLDLVFVIDASGSIGSSRFQLIREFIANIVANVVGSSPQSRVGVILFESNAHIQFDLRDHTSLNTLLPAINPGLPYSGGGTDTAEALTLLLSSSQNGALGIRNGVANVAIVITDGRSNSRSATLSAAASLHAANLFDVFAVGVDGADISELNAIASDPELVFFSNQFNSTGLRQLRESIIENLCSGAVGPIISFNPSGFLQNTKGQRQDVICSVTVPSEIDPDTVELEWLNADNITTDDGRITIISADNSTGLNSSTLSTTLRFDPLFEDDQGNYICYSVVNDTVKFQAVELTNFRLPNPVVLVTTLDDQVLGDPFTLDCTVITVIGISSAVDIIWTVDGRTVRIVNDTSATNNNNSAIYTDSLVLPELTALDNGRIYQCTVLINKNPPISFSGSVMLDFFAPVCFNTTRCAGGSIGSDSLSFNDSASFNDSISFNQCCFELSGVSFVSNEQCLLCPTTGCSIEVVKDVVFLIDTTRSIGSFRFQHIREFVANVTTDLKLISPDSRVGVILFDWFTRLQFNLQRHTSLSTLLPAINPGLPYINSYFSTNTGNALEFLLSSAQNGALEIRNETSNIAIVITDGRSSNQFLTQSAAAALHAANIFDIYAIGFGSADTNELRTIASDPRFVYFTNFYSEFALQELKMNITDQLCSVPSPRISLQPSGFFSGTIGQMQDLICSVTITSAIDPNSVQLIWLDSENIITSDNRVTVTPTNITSNAFSFTYTTVLQFAYLMEGDEGNYTCNLVADDMFESQTVRLQNFRIPLPVVEVTTLNTPTFGQLTTLQCNVISVRGISSRVDIIWTTGNTTVRRVDGIIPDITNNSAIYSNLLVTQPLRVRDDGRVYQCTVIFNTSPRIVRSRFIILDFPVPSCYITSSCSGDPLNQTITFSDCCTKYSGVSYDLDSRCQPCPISPNCTFVAVKDVVFVIDTTSSIGFSRFQLVREFTENITATLIANSPESLVGVILFDDFVRLQFNISRHTSLSTLLPAINPGLPYNRGFRTDTARALDFLRTSAQFGSLQLRNETSNVAIFITDGLSRSSFSTQSAAFRLHATNIFDVYAVGIGGNSLSELRTIASDPSLVFSTSFFDSFSAQRILEEVTEQLCFTPTPRTFLDPDVSRGIIGEAIDIVCTVTITSTVDLNLVNLNWVGITSSNRITVVPTVLTTDDSIGNIYTTIIRFDYLMEGDEGNYICNLMIEDSANSTIRLDLTIPAPVVNVTTMDDMVFGESLQLDCTVTAARGITTNATIQWFAINNLLGSTRLVRFVTVAGNISNDSVVFEDSLFIPSLNADDSFSGYRCDVFIFSPIQLVSGSGRIELDFQAPSCYLNTRCTGNPIGAITSFSECCNVLSGVAFNLGRQCRLCPQTDCPFQARDVVFVLDRSFAVRSFEFQLVRDFAESISIALKVGSPNSSVGMILFDRTAHIQFDLEEHTSLETLLPAIDELPYSGLFPTNTDTALRLLLSSAQNDTLGLRTDTSNIAILFTAGRSNNRFSTQIVANNIHEANIYDVYAVGIDAADFFELHTIASDPRFVYRRFSFSSFNVQQLQQSVINQLCAIPTPIVQVVAPCEQVVGQSLTLECNIAAASDIAATVDIIWTTGDTEVRRVEDIQGSLINNFTDFFTVPVLSKSNNDQEYHCKVVINTNPPITGNDSVVLNVTQPPQMIISPSQSPHIVKVGTQLLLYCAAEGLPIPTVQWHGDGVPVHPLEELYQQIFLVPTDSPHTTVYVCIGRNQVKGVDYVDQANVIVVVEEQPCPTIKPPRNGFVTVADDGKFAFFTCGQGFNIRGSYVLQCINGEWNYFPPTCTPIPEVCHKQCDI